MLKLFIVISLVFSTLLFSAEIDAKLQEYITFYPQKTVNVWIFLTDKGPDVGASLHKAKEIISERALNRRAKVKEQSLVSSSDYPVSQEYKTQIKLHVQRIRQESRWLNAVSAEVKSSQIEEIAKFSFVKEIRVLKSYKKRQFKEVGEKISLLNQMKKINALDYGNSLGQLEQINVPALHEKNLTGKGVVIAMLDDGFKMYKTHIAFDSINILATWDFVNNDSTVDDPDAISNKGEHGTSTLSVIAGYSPDYLIGPAFGASYLLAKTEVDSFELPIEEDNWVAGLEWAEANGADIVSSSVGYGYYASGNPSQSQWWYDWQDMDGQTAVTTLAANIAETNGLIIVNSAGNEGNNSEHNTLSAPADGEFIVTVGGVSSAGNRVSSSSVGPTADGRIKPNVMARGVTVYAASNSTNSSFTTVSGTSFSAPLVAGAIALLLEAFPDLTPQDVRVAIYNTASQASNPDNLMGYGILDINAAYNYILDTTSSGGYNKYPPDDFVLRQNYPNPFNGVTKIKYIVKNPSQVKMSVFDAAGKEIVVYPEKSVISEGNQIVSGEQLGASGIYFYRTEAMEITSGKKSSKIQKMVYLK